MHVFFLMLPLLGETNLFVPKRFVPWRL